MTGKPCYMSGTRLRAALGDVAVDDIQVGDEVVVYRNGQENLETVKWVGYASVDLAKHAHVEDAAPIRFRKDAIADSQPVRDLLLSPEHCLIIDGLCVPAKLLVNGGSIVSERNHAPFTYYHVELDRHGILLAENVPAESYLDTGNRNLFDDADGPRQLHPTFNFNAGSERWLTDACAPLAQVPDQVEPIWTRLAQRSQEIGHPIPNAQTVPDADVHVLADGQIVRPVSGRDARYVFMIPAGVSSVSLMSRFCIPSDKMIPSQRDSRRIGLSVSWIAIRANGSETIIPADHPALQDGWNDVERAGTTMWRWTDGAATIPWENITSSAVMTIRCTPVNEYLVYDAKLALIA